MMADVVKTCPHCGHAAERIEPMGDWIENGPPHYGPNGVRYVCGSLYADPPKPCPGRATAYGENADAEALAAWNTRTEKLNG